MSKEFGAELSNDKNKYAIIKLQIFRVAGTYPKQIPYLFYGSIFPFRKLNPMKCACIFLGYLPKSTLKSTSVFKYGIPDRGSLFNIIMHSSL